MVLKYFLSKAPARLENMLVKIYEAGNEAPGQEVYTETVFERDAFGVLAPGGGHNVVWPVVANGLDTVVHLVELWGETSGERIHWYYEEPKIDIVVVFDPIKFKIGDGGDLTPVAGTSSYTNPILEDLDPAVDFLVFRNGYGILFEDVHFTFDAPTGTIDLIAPDQFTGPPDEPNGEEITIIRKSKGVTTVVNDSVVAKWFKGFVDVVAATDYVNGHLRKLIRLSGSAVYTFTLAGEQPPPHYGFCFQHFGTAGTAKVRFLNGDLLWAGVPKTEIDIPRYWEACFVWDGVNWNVVYLSDSTVAAGAGGPIPAGTVLGTGRHSIGDLPAGDPAYSITHNKNIVGDYNVFISIMTNNPAHYGTDNKICHSWWHDTTGQKANKFNITLQEVSGEVQDISIVYLLIKA